VQATPEQRPTIALAIGDPAGISPELTAKVVALDEVRDAARVVVIGDRRVFDEGAKIAGVKIHDLEFQDLPLPQPSKIQKGVPSKEGGQSALANYRHALRMVADGKAQAVCFTPFNKQAMKLADKSYDDEIRFTAGVLGFKGVATEFNVLEKLWNARVTSHIPLARVSSSLSIENIVEALQLTHDALKAAGFNPPRIGVAALNPHAGDGGNFGREEIDIIEPAVKKARARGLPAEGPYPADTVFVRAKGGQFDAVLTMFHDQGQIAMKLIGFEQGVTVLGGYPFPVATAAHGSAYDIAGKGCADPTSLLEAVKLAVFMSAHKRRVHKKEV
jgi:4-hydroxythreonine-4-phosphate dehydrogenase